MDSMICEKRMSGEGGGIDKGPTGWDDPIRRPARMVPMVDAMNVHISFLEANRYEPLPTLSK